MKKYIKPQITEKEVKLNSFLMRNAGMNPFSDVSGFLNVGTVFSYCTGGCNAYDSLTGLCYSWTICPPNAGTAGLKDENYLRTLRITRKTF